jgi:protein-tyrosine phosphatase
MCPLLESGEHAKHFGLPKTPDAHARPCHSCSQRGTGPQLGHGSEVRFSAEYAKPDTLVIPTTPIRASHAEDLNSARSLGSRTSTPTSLPSLDLSTVATCPIYRSELAATCSRSCAANEDGLARFAIPAAEDQQQQQQQQQQQSKHFLSELGWSIEGNMTRRRFRSRSRSNGERDDWWQDLASQVEAETRKTKCSTGSESPDCPAAQRANADCSTERRTDAAQPLSPPGTSSGQPRSSQTGNRSVYGTENGVGHRSRAGSLGWVSRLRSRSPLRLHATAASGRPESLTPDASTTSGKAAGYTEATLPPVTPVSGQDVSSLVQHLSESISFVRSYLGVSGRKPAANAALLQHHGITHIVNASGLEVPNFFENEFRYLPLFIQDRDERFATEEMMQLFYPVCDFIDAARVAGGRVLIHCYQGISRSSALALAYLLIRESIWPLEEAVRQLLRVRPTACPNAAFLDALSEIELRILIGRYRAAMRNALLGQTGDFAYAAMTARNALFQNTFAATHHQNRALEPSMPTSAASPTASDGAASTGEAAKHKVRERSIATNRGYAQRTPSGERASSGRASSTVANAAPFRCISQFSTSRLTNLLSMWTLGSSTECPADTQPHTSDKCTLLRPEEVDELLKLRLFRLEKYRGMPSPTGHRGMRYLLLLRSFRSPLSPGHETERSGEPHSVGALDAGSGAQQDAATTQRSVRRASGCHSFYTGKLQRRIRIASDRCYVLHTPFSATFLGRLADSILERYPTGSAPEPAAGPVNRVRHRRSVSVGTQSMVHDPPSHALAAVRPEENEWLGDTRLFIWCGSRAPVELLYASLRLAWNIAITECLYVDSIHEKIAMWETLERELELALKTRQATNSFEMLTLYTIPNLPLHVVFEYHEPEEFTAHLHRSRSVLSRWFAFAI